MAKRTRIELYDDIDNGPADETLVFAIDGRSYEIDLSTKNAEALRAALAPYVAAGRKVSAGSRRRAAGGSDAGDIRAWAISQGIQVSSRGRVSAEVREAYAKAH
jgi:hypothetical protein